MKKVNKSVIILVILLVILAAYSIYSYTVYADYKEKYNACSSLEETGKSPSPITVCKWANSRSFWQVFFRLGPESPGPI